MNEFICLSIKLNTCVGGCLSKEHEKKKYREKCLFFLLCYININCPLHGAPTILLCPEAAVSQAGCAVLICKMEELLSTHTIKKVFIISTFLLR